MMCLLRRVLLWCALLLARGVAPVVWSSCSWHLLILLLKNPTA
jgi:hypothetical protein